MFVKFARITATLFIAAVLLAATAGAPTASAQGSLPEPANVTVENGSTAGEVIVSWDHVPGAGYYRIDWVARVDAESTVAELGPDYWIEAFVFVDVEKRTQAPHSSTRQSRTLTRLSPGFEYAFLN